MYILFYHSLSCLITLCEVNKAMEFAKIVNLRKKPAQSVPSGLFEPQGPFAFNCSLLSVCTCIALFQSKLILPCAQPLDDGGNSRG